MEAFPNDFVEFKKYIFLQMVLPICVYSQNDGLSLNIAIIVYSER